MATRRSLMLAGAGLLLLLLIIVPFLVWGKALEMRAQGLVGADISGPVLSATVIALLAADIILPLPSSLICAAAGAALDPASATVSIFAGLMACSLIGYELGRRFGRPMVRRLAGSRMRLPQVAGAATVSLTRPVPVLSEAVAVMAGAGGLPMRQFLPAAGLANLSVAVCYAWLGAAAQDAGGFLLVFAASLAVPAAGYGIYWSASRLRGSARSNRHSTGARTGAGKPEPTG